MTALSATMAKAIVIDTDGVGRARLVRAPGQHHQRQAGDDEAGDRPAHDLGAVTILDPGLRGGRCMTPGSGTSTMNPMTTVTTTKNLPNSSCIGNRATPPLMLKIVAYSISCSTDDRIVSCSFT